VSVDGTVLCDCLETGRAVPPPCEVWRDQCWTHAVDDARQKEVRAWAETACAHPQFWLVHHRVLQGSLQHYLKEHGDFPALRAALPTWNGSEVYPASAARCLAEFDRLDAVMSVGTMAVIVDVDDGTVVFVDGDSEQVSEARWGVQRTTLSADGVVRVVDADDRVLFESREFTQERDGDGWIFRDEVTGAIVRHGAPVNWWYDTPAADPPHHWRAETRPIDIDDYIPGGGLAAGAVRGVGAHRSARHLVLTFPTSVGAAGAGGASIGSDAWTTSRSGCGRWSLTTWTCLAGSPPNRA
jgi:hypothetical protein